MGGRLGIFRATSALSPGVASNRCKDDRANDYDGEPNDL
jgi:hypothetical protein